MIEYVGDLSRQDAEVLAELAGKSSSIIEFGVGASTQILTHYSPPDSPFLSIDTDQEWVDRTIIHLRRLGLEHRVRFELLSDFWQAWWADLAFIDGVHHLRNAFSRAVWDDLKVGGVLAVHDTRREEDRDWLVPFIADKWTEIERIEVNYKQSNITLIFKRLPLLYENWNSVEGRSYVQRGIVT